MKTIDLIQRVEKDSGFHIKSIRPISNSQEYHTNQVFRVYFSNEEIPQAYLKLYGSHETVKREVWCNEYLQIRRVRTPKILAYGVDTLYYLMTENVGDNKAFEDDLSEIISIVAGIHTNSMLFDSTTLDTAINEGILEYRTTDKRLEEIERQQTNLSKMGFIDSKTLDKIKKNIPEQVKIMGEDSFCFLDFFINNMKKFKGNIYLFDFERACVSVPFYDPACLIINFPNKSTLIKRTYYNNFIESLGKSKTHINSNIIFSWIDLAICERTLDIIDYMVDQDVEKPWSQDYCNSVAQNYKMILNDYLEVL